MNFADLKPDGPIARLHKTLQDVFSSLPHENGDDTADVLESVTIDVKDYIDEFPLGIPNNIGSFYLEKVGPCVYRVSRRVTLAD